MDLTNMSRTIGKAAMLLSLLLGRPLEFYDRVLMILAVRLKRLRARPVVYETREWQEVIRGMEKSLSKKLGTFLDEPSLAEITEEVRWRRQKNLSQAPFSLTNNADFNLARLCYIVCRATRPAIVLETGVAYGVTSAFILKALEVNGCGFLHSVDLPPLGRDTDQFVGILIPEALKHRWRLYRGMSKRVLPRLLPRLGRVDFFIHDSLHTYRNVRKEFQVIAPYLTSQSIVIADDVDKNQAFHEWVTKARPAFWATMRETEKKNLFGVSVFHDTCAYRS
ncbi:MAG: class I SAM-dependent methyltransferase [Candidatus Tectomicrobia bacterium]|nr:class I SAM-dependent methyltransferase [Candidatus Tectomicrobia bacterium]